MDFTEIDISTMPQAKQDAVKMALSFDTGYAQFPNIYFGTEHLGGFDDLIGYMQNQNIFDELMYKNGIQTSVTENSEEKEEVGQIAYERVNPEERRQSSVISPRSLREIRSQTEEQLSLSNM